MWTRLNVKSMYLHCQSYSIYKAITGFRSSKKLPNMHVVQVAAGGNTNVTAVNIMHRETSFTNTRTDTWPVNVSVKHVYTSKLILACHNWNGVQNLVPSPSRYGPTVNANQVVFKTTASTKQKISENHDQAVGIWCMCDHASYMKMTRGTNLMQQFYL